MAAYENKAQSLLFGIFFYNKQHKTKRFNVVELFRIVTVVVVVIVDLLNSVLLYPSINFSGVIIFTHGSQRRLAMNENYEHYHPIVSYSSQKKMAEPVLRKILNLA